MTRVNNQMNPKRVNPEDLKGKDLKKYTKAKDALHSKIRKKLISKQQENELLMTCAQVNILRIAIMWWKDPIIGGPDGEVLTIEDIKFLLPEIESEEEISLRLSSLVNLGLITQVYEDNTDPLNCGYRITEKGYLHSDWAFETFPNRIYL